MELEITSVKNESKAKDEYVRLKVLKETQARQFAIVDRTFNEKGESNKHRHFYHFPSKLLIENDTIIVHTGIGDTRADKAANNYVHHFYMGLKTPIWNQEGDNIEVYKIELVDSGKVVHS